MKAAHFDDAAANVTVLFERVLHDDVAGMRIASHGGDTRFKREFRAVGHQKRCCAAVLGAFCRHNAVHDAVDFVFCLPRAVINFVVCRLVAHIHGGTCKNIVFVIYHNTADFILNVLTQGVFVRVAVLPLIDAERPQRSFRVFQHLKQIGQVTELCISDLHFLSSFPVLPRRICKKIPCARYKYEHIQNYTIFCLPFQGKTCIILKYAVKYVPRTEKAKAVGIYRGICERTGLRGETP